MVKFVAVPRRLSLSLSPSHTLSLSLTPVLVLAAPGALAVGAKLFFRKAEKCWQEKGGKPEKEPEPLGLSELKLVGVVFSSKAALIDR